MLFVAVNEKWDIKSPILNKKECSVNACFI